MYHKSQSGYSFVQLALVVVIMGLIIGGVLAGRSLIATANIQEMGNQIQQIDSAVANFKQKYNAVPGDTNKVQPVGNGNRKVESEGKINLGDSFSGEVANFWPHLTKTRALLVTGQFSPTVNGHIKAGKGNGANIMSVPMGKVSGAGVVASYNNGDFNDMQLRGVYLFGDFGGNNGSNIGFNNIGDAFAPLDLAALDNKIDDGLPKAGMLRAFSKGASGQDCFDNGNPDRYDVSVKTAACSFALAQSRSVSVEQVIDTSTTSSTSSSSGVVMCGSEICAAGEKCCNDVCIDVADVCCPTGELVCGEGCCGAGMQCCDDECIDEVLPCCPVGQQACANGPDGCCPLGQKCCMDSCIPAADECCDTNAGMLLCGEECCTAGEQCCNGECIEITDMCCDMGAGYSKCGPLCCGPGEKCCNGLCISNTLPCCEPNEHLCGMMCCPGTGNSCSPDGQSCIVDCPSGDTYCTAGNDQWCCAAGYYCGIALNICDACPSGQFMCGDSCCSDSSTCCSGMCCDNGCNPAGTECKRVCPSGQSLCGEKCCDAGCNSAGDDCALCTGDQRVCNNGNGDFCCPSALMCGTTTNSCECPLGDVLCGEICCSNTQSCLDTNGDGTGDACGTVGCAPGSDPCPDTSLCCPSGTCAYIPGEPWLGIPDSYGCNSTSSSGGCNPPPGGCPDSQPTWVPYPTCSCDCQVDASSCQYGFDASTCSCEQSTSTGGSGGGCTCYHDGLDPNANPQCPDGENCVCKAGWSGKGCGRDPWGQCRSPVYCQ